MNEIVVGSKVRLKGRHIKGVSFKVLSINRWSDAEIKHSLSGEIYVVPLYELELILKQQKGIKDEN